MAAELPELPASGARGFPQAFGAAVGVWAAAKWQLGDAGIGVLTLVGYAVGDALDDWWIFFRTLGIRWREAKLEKQLRAYEREFDLPPDD